MQSPESARQCNPSTRSTSAALYSSPSPRHERRHAQLAAISASVAMKCVYCIPAHTAFARAAGATEEEIKTAVAIAADVALNSSMLYGNQFDMETFMEMFD
jgi:AhpD family alkylhydroperoxidase